MRRSEPICSKESVSLDLYVLFDRFRHQGMRINDIEQSESDIKREVAHENFVFCVMNARFCWRQFMTLFSLATASIKNSHIQYTILTMMNNVVQE